MPRMNPQAAGAVGALLVAAGAAVPLIASYEGYEPVGYRDPVGIVTSCWGHTKTAKLNVYYSQDACMAQLATDVVEHAVGILPCIKVEVPSKTLAAFVSFSFNVGAKAFCTSTLNRKLNAGDYWGACAELSRWDKGGGRVLPGLTRRRAEERAWCEEGLRRQAP